MWLLNLDLNQGQTLTFITAQSVALATELLRRNINFTKFQTKKNLLKAGFFNVAPQPGLEPGTNGLTVRCSTN